jgi:hypothetical protein
VSIESKAIHVEQVPREIGSDNFEDVSLFLGAVLGEVRNNDNNGHQIRDIWVLLISFHQKSMIYYDLIFDDLFW